MPRRYRPPTRRRKQKKQRTHQEGVTDRQDTVAGPPSPEAMASVTVEPRAASQAYHIPRDYSYLLTELRIIGVLAGLILLGMVLTAVFR